MSDVSSTRTTVTGDSDNKKNYFTLLRGLNLQWFQIFRRQDLMSELSKFRHKKA